MPPLSQLNTYFNSIKVQLKRKSIVFTFTLNIFQFHKGTIKTRRSGSISICNTYFNSIKVQLKLRMLMPDIDAEYNFNSIKVQLKRLRHIYKCNDTLFQFHKGTIKTVWRARGRELRVFQFHKGTIKTRLSASCACSAYYFNSIKVQLKHSGEDFVPQSR